MTASPASTLAKHELTDAEREVVYDIFTIARYHSRDCQEKHPALKRLIATEPTALAFTSTPIPPHRDDARQFQRPDV